MIRIQTIYSLFITLCWSVLVLLYGLSHEKIVTHAKTSGINVAHHADVDQEQHMCAFHLAHVAQHHIRVVRNTGNDHYLPALDHGKHLPACAAVSDRLLLHSNRLDVNPCTADRIILFQQIRI